MSELTVILKDDHRTYRHKSIIYEPFTISMNDPVILSKIAEAKLDFCGDPESIQIKVHMEFQ